MSETLLVSQEIRQSVFLIIIPNPALRRMLISQLRQIGIANVLEADKASSAIMHLRTNPQIHVILSCTQLPDIKQSQLMQMITQDKKTINSVKVLFSFDDTPDVIRKMFTMGCDEYVICPFAFVNIKNHIENGFAVRQKRQMMKEVKVELNHTCAILKNQAVDLCRCMLLSSKDCTIVTIQDYGVGTTVVMKFAVLGKQDAWYSPIKATISSVIRNGRKYEMKLTFTIKPERNHGIALLIARRLDAKEEQK